MQSVLDPGAVLAVLKAAAEPTRLRILVLLAGGELNVKDLTRILGQSQPRISRHLKLLAEAGLIKRLRDGSWVYFQVVDEGVRGKLLGRLLASIDASDLQLVRDAQRWDAVKREREAAAQEFFRSHAAEWDRIRSLHVAEGEVEAAMRDALGDGPFNFLVDLGTGTGRCLELFAGKYGRGLGLDMNHSMLAYARGKLDAAGLSNTQVRHGDIYHLALGDGAADAVVMHQVLHFLSEPAQAIREAARILAPGGHLLIVDFAPHDLEFLRESFAHERLGFPSAMVAEWLGDSGLELVSVRDLKPSASANGDKLTVTLWLARRAAASRESRIKHPSMEVIG
jgi:ArsR family transcriptional regulator